MERGRIRIAKRIVGGLILALLIIASPCSALADLSAKGSRHATGLDTPRGLKFGPDGKLHVAEAGTDGQTSTAKICPELQIGQWLDRCLPIALRGF